MELDAFDENEILDRLNTLKRLRGEDEAKLNQLIQVKSNLSRIANAQVKLNELYQTALKNLEHCTQDSKGLALDALDIQVFASADRVEITGVIPLALPTTERTSGCLISCTYYYPNGKESLNLLPR